MNRALYVRMSSEDFEALSDAARKSGKTVKEYVAEIIHRAARRRMP